MIRQSKTTVVDDLKGFASLPRRMSLGQIAYEKLKQAVLKGDFPPASHIVENRVADALGISRTPVREAIHKLEREGLLKRAPSGGYFVVGLTRQDIEETFGIRSVLESYAARLATVQHQEKDLYPLEERIREYQNCLDESRMGELTRINTEFHDLLYALSRSPKLIKMINDLIDPVYRFRKILLSVEEMARRSNEDHVSMIACIRKRDIEGVEKLVREHILRGREAVFRHFDLQQQEAL
jgi:DNA-binding GntR family transcriptional regulator